VVRTGGKDKYETQAERTREREWIGRKGMRKEGRKGTLQKPIALSH
jgi:hypothetical protein